MINKSESIKSLATALVEFHNQIGKVGKDKVNPFFKSKYADLATILTAIKEPLSKVSLAVTQFPVGEKGLSTLLMHSDSGEWMEATYEMTPSKNDPQGQGSAITYMRRYALGAVLQLNIDEDDDGNAASQPAKPAAKAKAATSLTAKPVDDYLCSKHGATLMRYPEKVENGKVTRKSFISCCKKEGDNWCKAYFTNIDHERVLQHPETGKIEVVAREAA
jgi:hypothetical protein